ncbi:MAG: hypothetical protein WCY98_02585 [Castellaniella sp.]
MKKAVFTICSANYLPTAKVLMDSLRTHEPDSRRVLVLVESSWTAGRMRALGEVLNCEIMPLSALNLPALERMAFQYDITEFNTSVKPFVFNALFDQGAGAAIYLDPDICLYAPLTNLWDVLEGHDAVVTPHITEPLPDDGCVPTNENMARCGQYNFGFVGLANQPDARRFVTWWAERLVDHCIFHPHHFYFVDQFYGALISSFVPSTCVWAHHSYNFAYWNASQRSLQGSVANGWVTGDGPLVFFHFSGFTAADPDALSRHQDRVRAEPGSALSEISHAYRAAVQANEASMAAFVEPYSFACYTDGTPIDLLERRAYRDLSSADKQLLPNPFDPELRDRLSVFHEINDVSGSPTGLLWQLWQLRQQGDAWRAQEISGLRRELDRAEAALQATRGSVSYRLGRLMTAPLRWLRDRLNVSA